MVRRPAAGARRCGRPGRRSARCGPSARALRLPGGAAHTERAKRASYPPVTVDPGILLRTATVDGPYRETARAWCAARFSRLKLHHRIRPTKVTRSPNFSQPTPPPTDRVSGVLDDVAPPSRSAHPPRRLLGHDRLRQNRPVYRLIGRPRPPWRPHPRHRPEGRPRQPRPRPRPDRRGLRRLGPQPRSDRPSLARRPRRRRPRRPGCLPRRRRRPPAHPRLRQELRPQGSDPPVHRIQPFGGSISPNFGPPPPLFNRPTARSTAVVTNGSFGFL
jgi:hypothetical protein